MGRLEYPFGGVFKVNKTAMKQNWKSTSWTGFHLLTVAGPKYYCTRPEGHRPNLDYRRTCTDHHRRPVQAGPGSVWWSGVGPWKNEHSLHFSGVAAEAYRKPRQQPQGTTAAGCPSFNLVRLRGGYGSQPEDFGWPRVPRSKVSRKYVFILWRAYKKCQVLFLFYVRVSTLSQYYLLLLSESCARQLF